MNDVEINITFVLPDVGESGWRYGFRPVVNMEDDPETRRMSVLHAFQRVQIAAMDKLEEEGAFE